MKAEHDKSMKRQVDLLERLDQKQRILERQLTGLTSFSRRVEKFLEQSVSEGATAPIEPPKVTRYEKERPTAMLAQTPGVSSSSTRPPQYLLVPEPPSVPNPPVPRMVLFQSRTEFDIGYHFSRCASARRGLKKIRMVLHSAWTVHLYTPTTQQKTDTKASLIDYDSHKIKRTVLSTTVAELYAFMKCYGSAQFYRGLRVYVTAQPVQLKFIFVPPMPITWSRPLPPCACRSKKRLYT